MDPGCLGFLVIGDYTIQLCGDDFIIPMIHKDSVIKEPGFLVESIRGSFFVAQMFLEKWFKPWHFEKVK